MAELRKAKLRVYVTVEGQRVNDEQVHELVVDYQRVDGAQAGPLNGVWTIVRATAWSSPSFRLGMWTDGRGARRGWSSWPAGSPRTRSWPSCSAGHRAGWAGRGWAGRGLPVLPPAARRRGVRRAGLPGPGPVRGGRAVSGLTAGHSRKVCEHGQTISQCRCPGAAKDRVAKVCPFPEHYPEKETQVELDVPVDIEEQRRLYLTAIERWAQDPEFHARCQRISDAILAAEGPQVADGARIGARIGAAVAFQQVEDEQAAQEAAAKFDPVKLAEELNESLRQMSDVVKGGVATLVAEGWDEELARPLVLSIVFKGITGGGQS
jgi:hypothetical protein